MVDARTREGEGAQNMTLMALFEHNKWNATLGTLFENNDIGEINSEGHALVVWEF